MPFEEEVLNELKDALLANAKELAKAFLGILKEDGKAMAMRGKEFTNTAQELLKELMAGKITKEEFDYELANLSLALQSYLAKEAYKKSRKYLAIFLNGLKALASIAISTLM